MYSGVDGGQAGDLADPGGTQELPRPHQDWQQQCGWLQVKALASLPLAV